MDVRIETNFQGALRSFTNARAIFTTTTLHEVAAVIVAAEKAAREGRFVIGFVSYEAAPAFEPHLRVRPGARLPLAWFASFDETTIPAERNDATEPLEWSLDIDRQSFRTHVERIRAEIAAGRTYQTNFTTRLRGCAPADAYALYQALSRAQGDGYHAFIETNEFTIACASPELFFEIDDRVIRTKPMKGTRPRGRFESEDARLARELAASEKDRAENLMIVDLLRNDVGRIARTGTVVVPALFDVERYRTVHQMTSTVTATLRDDVTLLDVFAALFPCGSVTGAPRISTMQLIAELEDAPRGIYCGALGMIEPGSNRAVFNVPIRTVCIDHGSATAVYGSGAGITYESNADDEYDEVIAKAAILTESWPDFDLLETMRAQNRTILRVDRHIARLLESARYFGWSIDEAAVRAMLATLSLEKAPCRIRLLAHPQRGLRVEVHALDAALPRPDDVPLSEREVEAALASVMARREHQDKTAPRMTRCGQCNGAAQIMAAPEQAFSSCNLTMVCGTHPAFRAFSIT